MNKKHYIKSVCWGFVVWVAMHNRNLQSEHSAYQVRSGIAAWLHSMTVNGCIGGGFRRNTLMRYLALNVAEQQPASACVWSVGSAGM